MHKTSVSLIALSASLLIPLAAGVFLYHSINHTSQLDCQNVQENLVTQMLNLERGFSEELAQIAVSFRPIPRIRSQDAWRTYLIESYSQWRTTTRWPDLVHSVSIEVRSGSGKVEFGTFEPASGDFSPQECPLPLVGFEKMLEDSASPQAFRLPFMNGGFASLMVVGHPTVAVPLLSPIAVENDTSPAADHRMKARNNRMVVRPPPGRPQAGDEEPPGWPRNRLFLPQHFQLAGWCFLELDQGYLESHVFPALVQQYFGASGLANYHVAIITGKPPEIIYALEPSLTPGTFSEYDAKVTIFAPRLHFLLRRPSLRSKARLILNQ